MKIPKVPASLIVEYTGSLRTAKIMHKYIYDTVYAKVVPNKILLYGQVQSGKTKNMIDFIKHMNYRGNRIFILLPNLKLAVNQFSNRLENENINNDIFTSNTTKFNSNIVLLMNNTYQIQQLKKISINTNFTLIIDECDICAKDLDPYLSNNHYLTNQLHVTATPFTLKEKYNKIVKMTEPDNYYGLDKLQIKYTHDYSIIIEDFLGKSHGMLLINKYYRIMDMKSLSYEISLRYPSIPVILLSSDKIVHLNGRGRLLSYSSVSDIIDRYKEHSHLIFIAHRYASRCISYVSSDYSRHLTHQVLNIKDVTNFIQSLRICGVYNDKPNLSLYLPEYRERVDKALVKYHKNIHKELDYLI